MELVWQQENCRIAGVMEKSWEFAPHGRVGIPEEKPGDHWWGDSLGCRGDSSIGELARLWNDQTKDSTRCEWDSFLLLRFLFLGSSKSLVNMSSHWKKQTPQTEPILFVALWRRSESALFRLASPMTQGGAFTNPGTCLTPRDNKERVCNCGSQSAGASCVTSCYGLRGKV